MKTFRIIFIAGAVILLFFKHEYSLSENSKPKNYFKNPFPDESIKNNFESGDIILRSGKGFISDVFRQFSLNDKKYSHAGIISVKQNKVFVYHILGGEAKQPTQMRKELLDSFCSATENNSFAIYRYDLTNTEKENMLNNLNSFSQKKIIFDSHFDLATDSAMYCTELVYKMVESATTKKNYLPVTVIDGNKFIAPDNLYINAHARLIYSYAY